MFTSRQTTMLHVFNKIVNVMFLTALQISHICEAIINLTWDKTLNEIDQV